MDINNKTLIIVLMIVLVLLFFGGFGFGMMGGGLGWLFSLIIFVALVFFIIWAFNQLNLGRRIR